jgi:hypothetical protein
MRKIPTGEPCAGELHARFGGRGRREPFPTPIAEEGVTGPKAANGDDVRAVIPAHAGIQVVSLLFVFPDRAVVLANQTHGDSAMI